MHTYFWKRAAAAALTAALLTSSALAAGPAAPEGWTSPFDDVTEGDWYYPYVAALNSQGVINGYGDGRFGAEDPTRAGDSIIMVLKAAGCESLTPLPDTHYAMVYANYAADRGWLSREEVPEDLNGQVSRLFIARLAAKALGLEPAVRDQEPAITTPSPFEDVDDGYITALYGQGIVTGNLEGGHRLFKPQDSIKRSELSAIVWQVMKYAGEQTPEEEPVPPQGPDLSAGQDEILKPEGPRDPGQPQVPDETVSPEGPAAPDEPQAPAGTIPFGNDFVDIVPGVAVSGYDPADFTLTDGRMGYSGRGASLGIDVAYYQGDIDWEKVAADGIGFALIRVGGRGYGLDTGRIYEDQKFSTYMQGAQDAGLEVGVYFFSQATTPEEAREEAAFVLEHLEGYRIHGPVVFDWENIDYDTARTDGMGAAAVTAAAQAFCQEVERAGYQPMIYFNRYIAYMLYELDQVDQWPFWIADYGATPKFYYDFDLWQYTDKGSVDGIQGSVDMNLRLKNW